MRKLLSALLVFFCFVNVSLAQRAEGIIKGALTDSSSKQPIADATVSVVSAKDSSLASFVLSSKQGEFEIKNLLPGGQQLGFSQQPTTLR